MLKILDCTLRDGGYYTNWDFNKQTVQNYVTAINQLPIDYIEVGYRNKSKKEYLGKYAYMPIFELQNIRLNTQKKIAVMLNEKDTAIDDLQLLIKPIKEYVDKIRIAVDPKNFKRACELSKAIKDYGFEVALNLMYMSRWKEIPCFYDNLKYINGIVDVLNMVDSFGGIFPEDICETMNLIKNETSVKIGFHGHNNLEMGLINAITAVKNGIDFIDATFLGMGRGAGNLKTELLLAYLNKHNGLKLDYNILGNVISEFEPLYLKHKWGTNLPYMISGINSFPQKEVMEWVTNRVYSFNNIVRALSNKKNKVADNDKFPLLEKKEYENILIIGGGRNAIEHYEGIKEFIKNKKDIALIHATARNSETFIDENVPQYFCLVGSEGQRITKNLNHKIKEKKPICVLPPYPRTMGTDVPAMLRETTYETPKNEIISKYTDSCTTLALELANYFNAKNIFIVGYDGYPNEMITNKERDLTLENESIFETYIQKYNKKLVSLTPTLYNQLSVTSIYQEL